MHIEPLVSKYLDYCLVERGLAAKTIRGKRQTLKRLTDFTRGATMTPMVVNAYNHHLASRGWSASSRRGEMKVIKAYITWLYKTGEIDHNWGADLELPKVVQKLYNIVPLETLEKIIDEGTKIRPWMNKRIRRIKQEHRDVLLFLARTGGRHSFVKNLNCMDIDIANQTYQVYSKGKIHLMPIPIDLLPMLARRSKGAGKAFNFDEHGIAKTLKEGCEVVGVQPMRVHDIRHSVVTGLLNSGLDLSMVSRLAGHSSVRITSDIYTHYNIEDKKSAINKNPVLRKNLKPQLRAEIVIEKLRKEGNVVGFERKGKRLTLTIDV